jgi:malate dehydrogenase (oxaloacetate-decarboxylating)(NADP+)
MAAEEVRRFGMEPKVALLSHSNYGSADSVSSVRMREAYLEIKRRDPELEIDGEMQADLALSEELRKGIMPNSTLSGAANLFVMPNVLSANIAFNLVKAMTDGITVGPLLLGAARPTHVLANTITPRGIINATAIATVGAQLFETSREDDTTHRLMQK